MAGAAPALKEQDAGIGCEELRRRVAPFGLWALPAHEVADRCGQVLWTGHRRVPHPLAGPLVAEPQKAPMAIPVGGVVRAGQPELLGDELDVVLVAGEEQPAGTDAELLRIGLQHRWCVVLGIDADRVEEDVLTNPVAQKPLHLYQPR